MRHQSWAAHILSSEARLFIASLHDVVLVRWHSASVRSEVPILMALSLGRPSAHPKG